MTYEDFMSEWFSPDETITVHTSGSTGTPKAIPLRKADMALSARLTCEFFYITPQSHLHCPLAFDYIAAKMMAVRSIVSGASLSYEKPSAHPLASLDVNATDPIDLLSIVPYQLEGLLEASHKVIIKNVLIGGAPITQEQRRLLKHAPFQCWTTYGMTETSSHVALKNVFTDKCFQALPGYEFNTDDRGCLVISHPDMSWRQLVTNDIVKLEDSHTFEWLGRYDDIINTGGIKVNPSEIEAKISKLYPELKFYISSKSSSQFGNEVVIVVDPDSRRSCESTDENLLSDIKNHLPRFHAPKEIIYKKIMYNSRGKLIREKLN